MRLATACLQRLTGPARSTVWVAAFGFGLVSLVVARSHPKGSFAETSWMAALVELGAGWAVIAAGLHLRLRRRGDRSGPLLAAAGVAWFFAEWNNPAIGVSVGFSLGLVAYAIGPPLLAHAVLAYPSGRLTWPLERAALVVAYASTGLVLGALPALFFDPYRQACALCPSNLMLVHDRPDLVLLLERWGVRLGLVWALALAALAAWRLLGSSGPMRQLVAPVLLAGIGYLVLVWMDFVHSLPRGVLSDDPFDHRLRLAQAGMLYGIALGVAWARIRARRTRAAVARVVVEFGESPPPGGLRDALAVLLDEPQLQIAYPVGEGGRYVDALGRAIDLEGRDARMIVPLVRQQETVAVLVHRAELLNDPESVEEVAAAARVALENERLQAKVRAQLEDLQASRSRIVATGDAERRRLERDLHDGAQQRLIGLSLSLRLARAWLRPDADPQVAASIDRADAELQLAIEALRELAHGIYPAVLTDEGLAAAVEALSERSPVPIRIVAVPDEERFQRLAEATAYFVIAEAAGPIAALRRAHGTVVSVRHAHDRLRVEIGQDGGGAVSQDLEVRLAEVADRVGALGGRFQVDQTSGSVLTIRAEIPCEL